MGIQAPARGTGPGSPVEHAAAAYARGELAQARIACDELLRSRPRDAQALHVLALVELREGHAAQALAAIDRALGSTPADASLHASRGTILRSSGRHEDAVEAFDLAMELSSRQPRLLSNRGNALAELDRLEEALASHDEALQAGGETAARLVNRGLVLQRLRRLDDALSDAERAAQVDPGSAAAQNLMGTLLQDLGRPAKAMLAFSRAVVLAPRDPLGFYHRANLLSKFGQFEAALDDYAKALVIAPGHRSARLNRATLLSDCERFDEADAEFGLLAGDRQVADPARWNNSLSLLRRGRFQDGWTSYESRWRSPTFKSFRLETGKPAWHRASPARSVLAWGEQGIGDEVMFASMLPDLAACAPDTIVAVDRRLVPLFARSFPGMRVSSREHIADLDFDSHVAFGSLGAHFRPTEASFPRTPFLACDEGAASRLRAGIADGRKPLVGISWSSTRVAASSKCVDAARLGAVPALRDARLVNLQYGNCTSDLERLAATGADIVQVAEVDNTSDIDGLAALVAACDVVVTISNVTAHLAGALGKTTFLLLAKPADWRWGISPARSHWYGSVRLLRQERPGDWDGVFERLDAALREALPGGPGRAIASTGIDAPGRR